MLGEVPLWLTIAAVLEAVLAGPFLHLARLDVRVMLRMVAAVEANGLEIAYQCEGTGPPLVFVHGAAEDGRVWRPQLASFADEFTVVAWDEPGAGRSLLGGVAEGRSWYALVAGDVDAAVSQVLEDYERHGEVIMRLLGQEERVPLLRRLADGGRSFITSGSSGSSPPSSRAGVARTALGCTPSSSPPPTSTRGSCCGGIFASADRRREAPWGSSSAASAAAWSARGKTSADVALSRLHQPAAGPRLRALAGFVERLDLLFVTLGGGQLAAPGHGVPEDRDHRLARREEALRQIEGDETFDGQQRFLEVAATLARERRLSRFVFLAERPA